MSQGPGKIMKILSLSPQSGHSGMEIHKPSKLIKEQYAN